MGPDVAAEAGQSSQADPAPPTMDSCEASNSYGDGSAGDGFVDAEHAKRTGSGRNKRKSAHSAEESHPGEFSGPKQTRFEANDSGHCGVEITPEGTVQIDVTLPPGLPVAALASSLLKSPEAASGTSIGKLPIKGEINFKISSDAGSSRIDTASQLQSLALSQEMFDSMPATASQLQSPAPSQEMSDNNAAVVAVRDSSEPAVEYKGQDNEELISLEVYMIKKDARDVYLIAEEGELSCYRDTGEVTGRFPVGQVIKSSVLAWGHIYLGLGDGKIAAFNIKLKGMDQEKRYSCFEEGEAVTCIRAVQELKVRLLYAISDRGNIVVCGEDTGSEVWRVDRKDYVPTAFGIKEGCIYVTTPDCKMHKLLQEGNNSMTNESFFCERAFLGIYFYNKFIIFCSCDGKIRLYHIKGDDLECKGVYYGAGKKDITCMDVTSNLVATGNSEGCWEVFKLITMKKLDERTRCRCSYRFAREEDLQYHLEHDHNGDR